MVTSGREAVINTEAHVSTELNLIRAFSTLADVAAWTPETQQSKHQVGYPTKISAFPESRSEDPALKAPGSQWFETLTPLPRPVSLIPKMIAFSNGIWSAPLPIPHRFPE